ncbi:MAG: ABC transporter permease [Clostridia bacterium]|nr:ABC transporter permease [Clostridia bacterium]
MKRKYIETVDKKIKAKRSFNTIVSLVIRNVRNQYRNSVLGIVWTVLNPLLFMIVISIVFSMLLKRNSADGLYFPVFILSGLTAFNLFNNSTTTALTSLVNNHGLLTKTRISPEIFPVADVLSAVVNFFFSFIAMCIVMLIFIKKEGVGFHLTMLMAFVPYLPAYILFCCGVSFILSTTYVYFRDIKHIYSVFKKLLYYLTPVFYSFSLIEGHATAKSLLMINPLYHYVTYFRSLVMGQVPSLLSHAIIYAWGIGMFLFGYVIFHFSKKKIPLYI